MREAPLSAHRLAFIGHPTVINLLGVGSALLDTRRAIRAIFRLAAYKYVSETVAARAMRNSRRRFHFRSVARRWK